jgi:acid phosphatase (class A)
MLKLLGCQLAVVACVLAGAASKADTFYISRDQLDLTRVLAPPPISLSDQEARDLADVLEAQRIRTPQQAERAVADDDLSIFRIAGEVLGPNFTEDNLPKTAGFARRFASDVRTLYRAANDFWRRRRPSQVSPDVKAIGHRSNNGSYPSGHAIRGYLLAIILGNMVPEKRHALFARGREYGMNRVVAGAHFPTDVQAGQMAATALAVAFMQNASFMKDFAETRIELRRALGLQLE